MDALQALCFDSPQDRLRFEQQQSDLLADVLKRRQHLVRELCDVSLLSDSRNLQAATTTPSTS